jgi:hypothetical protein
MQWFTSKDLRSSLQALLGVSTSARQRADDPATMNRVRKAMLALADRGPVQRSFVLVRRIRDAADLQALWFLRGDLMQWLARSQGEAAARVQLDEVSSLFADQLPRGLRSRPSPLNPAGRNSPDFPS